MIIITARIHTTPDELLCDDIITPKNKQVTLHCKMPDDLLRFEAVKWSQGAVLMTGSTFSNSTSSLKITAEEVRDKGNTFHDIQ